MKASARPKATPIPVWLAGSKTIAVVGKADRFFVRIFVAPWI
jgi:hypothetical protein